MVNKKFIYADHAATSALEPEAFEAMKEFLVDNFANPSQPYSFARNAKKAIQNARKTIAECINADEDEIFFTSCGTESNNWVIKSILYQNQKKGIITSNIEHHAILEACKRIEKFKDYYSTYIQVNSNGLVNPESLKKQFNIYNDVYLTSIMYANNEYGAIQPIKELASISHQNGALFHTDAVQAVGHVKINVKEMNIDMLSLSAHKFHGPKGVGAFYCRRGIPLNNLIDGGAQERGKRAGTENVAGIVGLATALRIADSELEQTAPRLTAMRDRLIDGILQSVPMCRLNGSRTNRLPGNCNISFLGLEGESLLLRLDLAGIAASSGSACASSSLDPSHVLLAIGLKHEVAHGSLRLSFSDVNDESDADYIIEVLPKIIDRLRAMSPLWDAIIHGRTIS